MSIELPDGDELLGLALAEYTDLLWHLEVAQRRIEAAVVAIVDACDRSGEYGSDGHRSVASWTMSATNCPRSTGVARKQTAQALRSMPAVAASFASGQVGSAQVRELGRLSANPRCNDQLASSDEVLLAAAKNLEFGDFRVVINRWQQLADTDGAADRHDRAHKRRDARTSQVGDTFRFETSHGVIEGEAMQQVFQRFIDHEFDIDWAATVAEHGDSACADLMPRSTSQRRADAYSALFQAAAAHGVGHGKAFDIVVSLICDIDQYEQYLSNEIADQPIDIDPATVRNRRCETITGTPVDPRQLVAASVVGRLRAIVVDGAGIIVKAGRLRRLFDGALRSAIHAVDPTCGWLGCTIRAQIAQIDHLQPASRGGPTDASNSKITCRHHNVFKHVSGHAVHRETDGSIIITRPNGTTLRPPDAA